jgi:hypothetical protein
VTVSISVIALRHHNWRLDLMDQNRMRVQARKLTSYWLVKAASGCHGSVRRPKKSVTPARPGQTSAIESGLRCGQGVVIGPVGVVAEFLGKLKEQVSEV